MDNINITLSISYTKKNFFKYTLQSEYLYSGTLLKFIPIYLILFVMIILSFFYYKNVNSGIFTIIIACLVPAYIGYKFTKSVNKEYNDYYKNNFLLRFNELGIETTILNETSFFNYDDIHKVIEDEEVIYIFLTSFICMYIPKITIDEKDKETINALLFEDTKHN